MLLMQPSLNWLFTTALVAVASLGVKHQSLLAIPTDADADVYVYVGILDDAREDLRGDKTDSIERRLVMPAFEKRSAEWQAVKHFWLRSVKWTVAFDGKNLGQVESQASSIEGDQINSDSSRAKQVIVTPLDRVPAVGKRSREFTGVSSLFGLTAVRRPLVVVSKPYYRDPDGWKRTQPSKGNYGIGAQSVSEALPTCGPLQRRRDC